MGWMHGGLYGWWLDIPILHISLVTEWGPREAAFPDNHYFVCEAFITAVQHSMHKHDRRIFSFLVVHRLSWRMKFNAGWIHIQIAVGAEFYIYAIRMCVPDE